jgi:hypothetical protein
MRANELVQDLDAALAEGSGDVHGRDSMKTAPSSHGPRPDDKPVNDWGEKSVAVIRRERAIDPDQTDELLQADVQRPR